MWRKIDIDNRNELVSMNYDLELMCMHAVDRSQGGLVGIDIWFYGTDDLLKYIADRSSNLRSLRLIMRCPTITNQGFIEAVVKLPLLEYLEVLHCSFSGETLIVAGHSYPNLKTLKLNWYFIFNAGEFNDNVALAIAESMPQLRHLMLSRNGLTNTGLNAILNGCPHLEHLDLSQCFNINLVGDLKKRCLDRIKDLRLANDSTAHFPLGTSFSVIDSDDDFNDLYGGYGIGAEYDSCTRDYHWE